RRRIHRFFGSDSPGSCFCDKQRLTRCDFWGIGIMEKRVLSGMQPSGPLHIGNLLGALENWIELQNDYRCFFFVADWHALSTNYEDTSRIKEFSRELVIDWLAAGIDPQRST